MNKLHLTMVAAFVLTVPATAQQVTRRANITGDAVDGKCTIEVVVDGAAEVEVQGNVGRLRNLSGQRPAWSRFVCNGRMPANPHDFRFRGIDGRGSVQLLQNPRQNGGRIVFRIDDPQGGREGYTVDLDGADRMEANGAARTRVGGADPILEAIVGSRNRGIPLVGADLVAVVTAVARARTAIADTTTKVGGGMQRAQQRLSECARQRSPRESSVMAFETSLSATWSRTTTQAGMIL